MRPANVGGRNWLEYNRYFILEHFLGPQRFGRLYGSRKRALFADIDRELHDGGLGRALEVECVDKDLSPQDFKQRRADRVLVFRRAAADWSSAKKWTLDFFVEHYGHNQIILNDNPGLVDPKNPQEFDRLSLGDYIGMLKQGSLNYLKFSRFVDENPELKGDLDLRWLRQYRLPASFREETYVFIGGRGTITPVHSGFSGNLFVQIEGTKKWIVYPANERLFLDPTAERLFYYYSRANPHDTTDPSFPLLKYARRYEFLLEPGDVLWVPPLAWHQVENLTHAIGIAYRFNNIPAAFRASKVLTLLMFMATKPNIFRHFLATMLQKQAYIFVRRQSPSVQ